LPNAAETQVRDDGDGADAEKIAVTFSSEFIVTRQVPLPVQAPPQPLKVAPPVGVAVSITGVPLAKFTVQMDPQLIPAGELVTVPLPDTLTESV
jgi:hypothetical protein